MNNSGQAYVGVKSAKHLLGPCVALRSKSHDEHKR